MDETTSQSQAPKNSPMKWVIPVVVIGLIVLAAIAYFLTQQNQPSTRSAVQSGQESVSGKDATPMPQTGQAGARADGILEEGSGNSEYKNGTLEAEGTYVTPGGSRNVDVTVTLANGVITDATFVGNATDPNSRRFQNEFRDNFKTEVVGKNIDEVQLTKVAGSSLSPKGFMDALSKIKTEAQS